MGPKLLIFSARRQDLSPEQYRHHYETIHIPLLRMILGSAFPLINERNYIPRLENGKVQVVIGEGYMEHDCITECLFADEEHFGRAMAVLGTAGLKERIEEDEARFLDTAKTKIVLVSAEVTRGSAE